MLLLSTHSLDPCLWGESVLPDVRTPTSLSLHLTSSSITPAGSVHKSRGDNVVHMWVQLTRWCVFASTLCKYDVRKGDLFVLSWVRVRRVGRGSTSSELLCSGGVRSILLLPLVAKCLETIDVCKWHMFVCMSVVVVFGALECWSMLCVCDGDVMDVVFSVLYCEACSCKCSCMGSMSVPSCSCCMFVSCVHPVAVLNAGPGCKKRPYGRDIPQSRSHNCLVCSHKCLLLFTSSCCRECFYDVCACTEMCCMWVLGIR